MGIPQSLRFPTQTTNGNTAQIYWAGGRGTFSAVGTFGAGTCKLQWSPDDGTTWIDVDKSGDTFCTFTSNGGGGFELAQCHLRCALAGATSPSIAAGVESSVYQV